MNEPTRQDVYTHGHHESVLRGHSWRTAANSAAYLLGHLAPGMRILDVGCGPATITLDLAQLIGPDGDVIGLEVAPDVLDVARANQAERGLTNVTFVEGTVYALDYPDGAFDVTHAHQVLQHLSDPRAALAEMQRVTRPGGLVAVRDADYHAMTWYPPDPRLDAWMDTYQKVARHNAAEPDAGRHLLSWALDIGFSEIIPTGDVWVFATPGDRQWWGGQWVDRALSSAFASQAVEYGYATRADLESISAAFHHWRAQPDGWFALVHGELLCRV